MIPFSCAVETLRTANRLSESCLFEWQFFSSSGSFVESNIGISIPTQPLAEARDLETLIICASEDAQHFDDTATINLLRKMDKQGVNLGTVSWGSFILAKAGLLDHCRSTIHWESIPVLKEAYPQLEITFTLYEIDSNRFTCSGGTATLDMMLKLIENQHGRCLAQKISQYYHHDRIRSGIDSQQMAGRLDLAMNAPILIDVINVMEANIEIPLSLNAIAKRCNLSLRQIERLFHKHRNRTPSQFYLSLRLSHAKQLILNTNRSVIDISIASGFETQSYFSYSYHKLFGITPRGHRTKVATELKTKAMI